MSQKILTGRKTKIKKKKKKNQKKKKKKKKKKSSFQQIILNPNVRVSFTVESSYYAPNFEEVEEAYWFGPVRACVRASVRGSHFSYGQERLEIVS